MKRSKVVKTELGWEPAFWFDGCTLADGSIIEPGYIIEPGFALQCRKDAQESLDRCNAESEAIDAQQRIYASQYDYACGYRD